MRVLVMDIGGTKIATTVIDTSFQMTDVKTLPTHVENGAHALIEQLINIGQDARKQYADIAAVSLSSAGPLDLKTGSWHSPTNFLTNGKAWGNVPVVEPLKKALGIPVYLENDAACAALGYYGLERGHVESLSVVTLGTGVGIGTLVDGQLVRSHWGGHPEVSHIPLHAGELTAPCKCGRYGCIEAYLSSLHFSERTSQKQQKKLSTEDIAEAAQSGKSWAIAAFSDYARRLADSFMILKTLYDPQQIVVSGGLAAISNLFIDETEQRFKQMIGELKSEVLPTSVVVASYTYELSLFGAAQNAFRARDADL